MPKPKRAKPRKIMYPEVVAATPDGFSEWGAPDMTGARVACCDCGLVHEHQFKVVRRIGKRRGDISKAYAIKDHDVFIVMRTRRMEGETRRVRKKLTGTLPKGTR
jgi:hypothetical protein